MKKNKHQEKERTMQVAKALISGIGAALLVGGVVIFPGMVPLIKWIEKLSLNQPQKSRYAFARLQKRGLVLVTKSPGSVKVTLAPEGKRLFSRYRLQDLTVVRPERWDTKWRLVMFDVPESRRIVRDSIRKNLARLGFATVQKSVYVHPYPCEEVITTLREYYHLLPGQLYIFDATIKEGEQTLRRHFKLPF